MENALQTLGAKNQTRKPYIRSTYTINKNICHKQEMRTPTSHKNSKRKIVTKNLTKKKKTLSGIGIKIEQNDTTHKRSLINQQAIR